MRSPHRDHSMGSVMGMVLAGVLLGLYVSGLCWFLGYRRGASEAFLIDKRIAEGPEITAQTPAPWAQNDVPAGRRKGDGTTSEPRGQDGAVALDMTRPIRITWPLDIGPEPFAEKSQEHVCLRARQGVNEIQTPGMGKALYAFRVREAGEYRAWFHVRWIDDGLGHIQCNDSWFGGFDDRPAAVIGNRGKDSRWHWEAGPTGHLEEGVHWLRVELREDGALMDRAAIVSADVQGEAARLDAVVMLTPGGFEGVTPPLHGQWPVQPVEICALPTGSLAIGKGHVNEITVCASYQGTGGGAFHGTVEVCCPTAPGVVVNGTRQIECGPEAPFTRNLLTLQLPDRAARRLHKTTVTVQDEGGTTVFRDEIRFAKGYAWAFLGPFRDSSNRSRQVYRYTGSLDSLKQACDSDPRRIALLLSAEQLALAKLPLSAGEEAVQWRTVADGSCYDWTGAVDLQEVYDVNGRAFAYAVTWLNAEVNLNHRSFTFQVDDAGWLWVNGHTLVIMPFDLPREANRLWVSAGLKRGPNPVVVKLTQNQRYWGFRFGVVDWHWQGRRGDVVTGVEPDKWPGK